MTLLNGLLAFGAAAFTIPLVIHLLNRSRFQTVDWGAMQFLQSSTKVNSRRIQWQQLLLLLLRCAIPVLLSLAMARPLLHSFLSADGLSPISLAIIVDDSLSMFATELPGDRANSITRFEQACKSAAEILDQLPSGSNALVVLGGSTPELLPEQVPDVLAVRLREIGKRLIPAGDCALQDSIGQSLKWLATSQNSRRQLVAISDFQNNEWSQSANGQVAEMANLIAGQSIPPTLSFMRVGPKVETNKTYIPNLSVDVLDVVPSQLAIECDATISVTVGNHSNSKSETAQVSWMVDEIEIDRQQIILDAASSTQIRTRWSPKRIGNYVVRAQVHIDDALKQDNTLSTIAVVQNPLPILIVDGDIRSEAMQSESDFLRIALSPFSLLGGKKGDSFSSKTVSPDQLTEAILMGCRAVFLCNVSQVNEDQQRWLRRFVEQGNGLIVFLGDKVNIEHYQRWPTIYNDGLRIARLSPREKTFGDLAKAQGVTSIEVESSPGSRLRVQQVEFSPLRELSSVSLNSLASVRFENRTPMELDTESPPGSLDASVAMRFDDGKPWMLESTIGKGRCLWIGSACDNDESNLPSRSIFVPLVQKLTAYVCNLEPQSSNLNCGDPWNQEIGDANYQKVKLGSRVFVTKPDGAKLNAKLTTDGQINFADTRLQGTYVARLRSMNADEPLEKEPKNAALTQWSACVRVNDHRNGKESSLHYLNSDELTKLATLGNASVSTGSKEFLSQSRADWHGREVWTWIWSALLFCFLAEMAIAQRLSPRLKTRLASVHKVSQGTAR